MPGYCYALRYTVRWRRASRRASVARRGSEHAYAELLERIGKRDEAGGGDGGSDDADGLAQIAVACVTAVRCAEQGRG